ncbi:MAG: peptidase MA family metallohydrolase [Myxococcota bacterium]|nr:peptidase MA family metallohydrolase [Myxococcota bacterium]
MRGLAAVLVLLASAAGAARPREESGAARAHRLMQEWRVEEAEREVKALVSSRPRDLETVLVHAELRFLQGDYAGAAKQLREVLQGGRLPMGEASEWRTLAELAASTAEVTGGFSEQLSPRGHFLLRYGPRDALLVPYAGEALERAWEALGEDFAALGDPEAVWPAGPVRVEIYGEVVDLARVSTLTLKEIETSGTIALCKWNRLMIVSPRALVRGYPWLDTLVHEYVHYILSRVSRGTMPIWLHEGLAKFLERRWRGPPGGGLTPAMEHLLASALARKRFITFAEMHPSMAKLPSQEDTALAFAEVYTVVEYLHKRSGFSGIHRLIKEMSSGAGEGRAMMAALGMSMEDFERSWQGWLKGRKLKSRGGLLQPQLKFRKAPPGRRGKREPIEDDDSGEVADPRARGFARLGGMLRARGRLRAAAAEYEKAQGLLGAAHPAVAGKLARTYLELGELDRAIAAADPVRELYPELAGPNVTLGMAWLKKGEPQRALPYLEAANRVNPFDPTVHCGLEQALSALKSPLAAREAQACQQLMNWSLHSPPP